MIPLPRIDETLAAIIPFMDKYAAAETVEEKAMIAIEFVSGKGTKDIYYLIKAAQYLEIDSLSRAAAAELPVWSNYRVWSYFRF